MKSLTNVSKPTNSMWVSANAGSGKTRNLITRVARLLLQGASPDKILCLTYTTAAANEMQERLFKELGTWSMKSDHALTETLLALDDQFFSKNIEKSAILNMARRLFAKALETPGGLKIQTIHGFCSSVLRKFPLEINISPNFKVLDERQREEFVNRAITEILSEDPRAFDNVIKLLAVYDIQHFINQILINRPILEKPFELNDFCKCFGLSGQEFDVQNELSRIFSDLPRDILELISSAFLNGSRMDIQQINHLKNIEQVVDTEKLEMLESFFCTHNGKLRSSRGFPSKKAKLSDPKLERLFCKFKSNFSSYLVRRTESAVIKKAQFLYEFSHMFFKIFDEIKIVENSLDYEDLIIKTRDLLINYESKWVLFKLDGGIDHILLDEAQDTSIYQWEMLASLMEDFFSDERSINGERTFYAVGDEKQSIYSFQGANINSFSFMKDYFSRKLSAQGNKLETVELQESFRSSRAILSFANEILLEGGGTGVKNIKEHIAFHEELPGRVELWPLLIDEEPTTQKTWWNFEREVVCVSAVERLAEKIAYKIKSILASNKKIFDPHCEFADQQRKVLPRDFLILVRKRGPLFTSILKKLSAYNLPVAGSDRLLLLEELAVKDIISLLKFLTNNSDDLSLAEALRSPLLGLSEADLFQIAYNRNSSLFDSLKSNFPNHDACDILKSLIDDAKQLAPYELIEKILINHNGRLRMSTRLGNDVNDILDEFLLQALNYEELGPPSTFGFLVWLDGIQVAVKRQLHNESLNIRVMTIHGSKGLESPIVIIPDTLSSAKKFKKRLFLEKEGWICLWDNEPYLPEEFEILRERKRLNEIEEENRLFYVCITRARSWLIICGAGKKQDEDDSEESNWYTRSKIALDNLNKKEFSLSKKEGGRTLVYNHNWHLNNFVVWSQDSNNTQFDFNNKFPRKRLKSLLSIKDVLLNRSNYSITVSEMIRSLNQLRAVKSHKQSVDGTYFNGTSVYGAVVHLFLQLLPNYSSKNINDVKDFVYKRFKDQVKDSDLVEKAFLESQGVVNHSRLGPLFKDPNSYRELSVSSLLALPKAFGGGAKREVRIRGRLDLLNLSLSKVLIVDFKTHSNVPSSVKAVDICVLAQLELYSRILNQVYPDQDISTAVLWTKTASLMKIPRMNSDKALNSLFANQVLDDIKVGS